MLGPDGYICRYTIYTHRGTGAHKLPYLSVGMSSSVAGNRLAELQLASHEFTACENAAKPKRARPPTGPRATSQRRRHSASSLGGTPLGPRCSRTLVCVGVAPVAKVQVEPTTGSARSAVRFSFHFPALRALLMKKFQATSNLRAGKTGVSSLLGR